MSWDDLNIEWDLDIVDIKKDDISEINEPIEKKSKRRSVECLELSLKYEYKRAHSEIKLLESLNYEKFKENHSYNFITGGDVDALSYLKLILNQQKIEHLIFSTWCMAAEDVLQIKEWHENGFIKKIDAYVGEIFPNSYKVEFKMLQDFYEKTKCGRLVVFKNHSKIFAGFGNSFYFGIQTSANINTNPRTENGCITINKEIYDFYKSYFDRIKSFI